MAQQKDPTVEQAGADQQWNTIQRRIPYEVWMKSTGLPVYTGYAVEDPRALPLGEWRERGCEAAFLQIEGVRSVSEARLTGLAARRTTEPWKTDAGELVYVLDGDGEATVWTTDGPNRTFAWQKHSLFLLPRNCWHQLRNAGSERALLLSYSHLPMAMSAIPDVAFHFKSPAEEPRQIAADDFYSRLATKSRDEATWDANAVANVNAWQRLEDQTERGPENRVSRFEIASGDMSWHLSEFGPGLYKKAQKVGPARLIVVTKGEGYSAMWFKAGIGVSSTRFRTDLPPLDEDGRAIVPWREGSIFAAPDNWYCQHFNKSEGAARYVALHPLPQFSGSSYQHQIEYQDEDLWFGNRFADELAKRGTPNRMTVAERSDAASDVSRPGNS